MAQSAKNMHVDVREEEEEEEKNEIAHGATLSCILMKQTHSLLSCLKWPAGCKSGTESLI